MEASETKSSRLSAPPASPWRNVAVWAAAIIVAAIFIYAALPKLSEPLPFAEAIRNFRMVPDQYAEWIAITLPPLELAVGLALFVPALRRGAALIAAGMLFAFVVAIVQALFRDINIDCGCFGGSTQSDADWFAVLRNLVLISLCALVMFWGKRNQALKTST